MHCCNLCNYKCHKVSHLTQHFSTKKHIQEYNKMLDIHTCGCGKSYKFKSGLYRHSKTCVYNTHNPSTCEDNEVTVSMEQYGILMTGIRELIPLVKKGLDVSNSKVTNNKVSINVFLNERCKDAINLADFVGDMKVGVDDLMYTKENGYVKGISNIIAKQLESMEPIHRPIHCSDDKRMKFYVKDDNKWYKEKAVSKINDAVFNINRKQWSAIKEWEILHPGYEDNTVLYKEYMELVMTTMGGADNKTAEINSRQIKRLLGASVKISTDMLNDIKNNSSA
jgi:hypothetical protein